MENIFNKLRSIEEALKYIDDGSVIMYGGFGGVGTPPGIIDKIIEKGVRNLTIIGNDTSFPYSGVGKLICSGVVSKVITSHIGVNPVTIEMMNAGKLIVEFFPQGTLAEKIRAGGAGIAGFLTSTGIGTSVEAGKHKILLDGKEFLLETALRADVAIVHAKQADVFGNLTFRKTARNFNPFVAAAANITIVEADEIVELGEIDPELVVTPGSYVDIITNNTL